jgi:hypothetical protein
MEFDESDKNSTSLSFWKEVDSIPINLREKVKKLQFKLFKEIANPPKSRFIRLNDQNTSKNPPASTKDFEIKNLSDIMQRLPEYKQEKLKIAEIKEKLSTRQELKNSILSIQQNFQKESIDLTMKRDQMYEIFSEKKKIFDGMSENFSVQSNLCRTTNIIKTDFESQIIHHDLLKECRDLKDQIMIETLKLNVIQKVHLECQEEAEIAVKKAEHAGDFLNELKNSHDQTKKKMEQKILNKENKIKEEILLIKADYEKYKLKIEQELIIRNLVEERQKSFIGNLMDELKNMKLVLQNPTLRMRTYERLKESVTPNNLSTTFPIINTTNLLGGKFNSKLCSGYLSTRSNKSTRRTKSSAKPLM